MTKQSRNRRKERRAERSRELKEFWEEVERSTASYKAGKYTVHKVQPYTP